MTPPGSAWKAILRRCAPAFTSPSFTLFYELLSAWVCATGRRTICGMVAVMDPANRAAHDAYHRFVRAGAWQPSQLWAQMVALAVEHLGPDGPIVCLLDDTLMHRHGPNVNGAGSYRDAVRSTHSRVVFARGLNLVVLAIRVVPPWGGMPIAIPVGIRLHRKDGPKLPALAAQLMTELADRLPHRRFTLCADGAYACLAGDALPRTTVISRMRRDAALFAPPPPPTGKRGRPRAKGERLPTPPRLAEAARQWKTLNIDWRGGSETKLVWSRPVLWYGVCPKNMVLLVVVRDPTGREPDDFFFTTDLEMTPALVVSIYADRWAIEVTYRDVKQLAHGQEPQTWKGEGPERAANLAFWLHGAIWLCYLKTTGTTPTFTTQPWYTTKHAPSFADALAELRKAIWRERITPTFSNDKLSPEMTTVLVEALATAA
ncbi:MAG: transposase [Actinomycetota bacterium]|nr:transposase [Actinomycetota bacterium]MDQ6945880.1 transposase [Actinomycetota bacterium]